MSLTPLQQALLAIETLKIQLAAARAGDPGAIAIVGMGCRFPGGVESPSGFLDLLREGREAVRDLPADRPALGGLYDPDPAKPGKMYMRRAALIDGVDLFDAAFFRVTRREAEGMDPQQRLFLEVSWEALEDAGIPPPTLAGTRTSVFAGVHAKDYAQLAAGGLSAIDARYSPGVDPSYVAGRLSYFLGLHGPSMAVDTACSSSLAAVHLACQSLRTDESTLAIAGGVKLVLSPHLSLFLCKAGALSPSGACRAFDRDADGMVQGEGCGVVVLKRLRDARRDGDRILATIRGSALNHDGAGGGLTVPNPGAQEALYRLALQRAGVDAREVDYLEAHGTGTKLGDPIELQGVARVYGAGRPAERPLLLGSVKTNIGHAEAAAGVAGLIKAVLVLQTGEVPESLNFEHPTTEIAWEGSGIEVARARAALPDKAGPRLAAVSSFGMSGINAHVILEAPEAAPRGSSGEGPWLLPLSARTGGALRALADRCASFFSSPSDAASIDDACFTAGAGRAHHEERLAAVAGTREELCAILSAAAAGRDHPGLFRGQANRALVVPAIPGGGDARREILRDAALRYCAGESLRFDDLHPGARKTSFPTYPWQRERYWWDGSLAAPATAAPAATLERADPGDVFFDVTWEERGSGGGERRLHGAWLVVAPDRASAEEVAAGLSSAGAAAITASFGPRHQRLSAASHQLDFADRGAVERLFADLAGSGEPLQGVVYWAASDGAGMRDTAGDPCATALGACVAVTSIASALARADGQRARLHLVTRGAQRTFHHEEGAVSIAGAPLWGLGRVLPYEHPELRCTRIDIDPGAEASPIRDLVAELGRQGEDDDEIALRGGRRFAPSLVRATPGAGGPLRISAERTYLITGGLGGLGLRVASWLVARGARHLALCGRTERAPGEIAAIRAAGARVATHRVDVGDRDALAGALAAIRRDLPAIGGVFHCAGVLSDGALRDLDAGRFEAVMHPKAQGAWNLHGLVTDPTLELFVLFSSTASMIGAPLQANYAAANAFLDALAHLRRAQGKPAVSLCWGSWAEVGMAAADPRRGDRLTDRGMTPLPVDRALAAMEAALVRDAPVQGIADLDPARWCRSHATVSTSSLFRLLAGQESASAKPARLRDRLRALDVSARAQAVEAHLRGLVADVIRSDPARVPVNESFGALGFDSMMSVELRDRVTADLEMSVPLKCFVDESSIEILTVELLERIALAFVIGSAGADSDGSSRILL